jgi:hypothetical protein
VGTLIDLLVDSTVQPGELVDTAAWMASRRAAETPNEPLAGDIDRRREGR